MDRDKKEIFQLLKFLVEIKTQHKRLNKKRIDLFNFDKEIYRIESAKYCRSSKIKSSAKVLDNNRIVIKMRLSRYGYYKVLVKAKEISKEDIVFLNSVLRYFFE